MNYRTKYKSLKDALTDPDRVIELDCRKGIISTRDLTQFPNLKTLVLVECTLELSQNIRLDNIQSLTLENLNNDKPELIIGLPVIFPELRILSIEKMESAHFLHLTIEEFCFLEQLHITGVLKEWIFTKRKSKIYSTLEKLTIADLQSNEIPKSIKYFQNLEVLSLYNNGLLTVPTEITQLKKLRILNLSMNKLKALPRKLNELPLLAELNLGGNQFKSIPKVVFECRLLYYLNFWNNLISRLPSEVCQLKQLRSLNLTNCRLKSLPSSLKELTSLRYLKVEANRIKHFPKVICEMPFLEELSISFNHIAGVPKEIGKMKGLRTLKLGTLESGELPNSLADIPHLNTLLLSEATFKKFPAVLLKVQPERHSSIPWRLFYKSFVKVNKDVKLPDVKALEKAIELINPTLETVKISEKHIFELQALIMPTLQRRLQKLLVKEQNVMKSIPQRSTYKYYVVGERNDDFAYVNPVFEYVEDFATTDLIVLGEQMNLTNFKKTKKEKKPILTSKQFIDFTFQKCPPFLLQAENVALVDNLESLVTNPEKSNQLLAINMMATGGVPQKYKTFLMKSVAEWHRDTENKAVLLRACYLHLNENELDAAEYFFGFYLEEYSIPYHQSLAVLREKCQLAGLDFTVLQDYCKERGRLS